jgi:hypothetical protein
MFAGILIGGWTLQYGKVHPQIIFLSLGLVLLCLLLPALFPLADEGMRNPDGSAMEPPAFDENVSRIWSAVQLDSIWQPMIFVYIWNVLPNDGDAWVNYLMKKLHFSDEEYSYILAIGTLSGALGAFLYRACLRNTPLHPIFYSTIAISALLSCIPFILIFRLNRSWDLPDFAFALGNEVINDVAGFIMYMPVLIMCSKLCPNQVEGSVYALTCVVNNIGNQIAMNFSSMLTDEFGITLDNYDNLWQLHLLVVLLMFVPMLFVWLTPNKPGDGNPDELRRSADRLQVVLNSRRGKRMLLSRSRAHSRAREDSEEEDAAETGALLHRRRSDVPEAPSAPDAMDRTSDGEPASEESPSSGCCACCTVDADEDVEINEEDVSDAEWLRQEQEMVKQIDDFNHEASTSVQPTSFWGGTVFLVTIFGSLLWSTSHAIWRISRI